MAISKKTLGKSAFVEGFSLAIKNTSTVQAKIKAKLNKQKLKSLGGIHK
jgi:hypothetical protein